MRICHVPFEGLHRKLLCWLALSAVVGWILLPSPATAAPRPAVKKPPRALTALWWKAYVGIPGSEAASRCDLGVGKVVFLGAFTGESASRSCTLRAGTSILVPLINVECSSLEVGTDFFGATVAERRACAARFADEFTDLFLTINGVAVGDPMSRFRVQSPPFRFSPVEGNFNGIPAGTGGSVSDGYWALIGPLAPGTYDVSFGGSYPPLGFSPSLNYHLTVV